MNQKLSRERCLRQHAGRQTERYGQYPGYDTCWKTALQREMPVHGQTDKKRGQAGHQYCHEHDNQRKHPPRPVLTSQFGGPYQQTKGTGREPRTGDYAKRKFQGI